LALAGLIAVLGLLDDVPGWFALLLLTGSFGALGLAGWLYGVDTRDGRDWKPHRVPY
jgi:hypothetical protein